jgi:phosphoserine phosphatase
MDGETIDFFAKELGLEEKVATITEQAMQGELDFFESLITRVRLLQNLSYEKVEFTGTTMNYCTVKDFSGNTYTG